MDALSLVMLGLALFIFIGEVASQSKGGYMV